MKELLLKDAAYWHIAVLASETIEVPSSFVLVPEMCLFQPHTMKARSH